MVTSTDASLSIHDAVADYCAAHKMLSPATQRNAKQRLAYFAAWCEEHSMTLETLSARHIRQYLDEIAQHPGMKTATVKASTLLAYSKTIKAFLHWCVQQGDEYAINSKIIARVEHIKVDETIIETFSAAQIEALFDACETMPYPVRDRAIVAVLLDTGIRASELVGLTLDCVWLDADDSYIKVVGKGRKERECPLGRAARIALRRYITRYRKPARKGEQRVFLGGNTGKPITRGGLHQIVAKIGRKAHIKGVHPHRFRHTMACFYLLNGGDVYKLSRLLGHSEMSITEMYLRAIKSKQVRMENHSVLDRLKSL